MALVSGGVIDWVDSKKRYAFVVFPNHNLIKPFLIHVDEDDLASLAEELGCVPKCLEANQP